MRGVFALLLCLVAAMLAVCVQAGQPWEGRTYPSEFSQTDLPETMVEAIKLFDFYAFANEAQPYISLKSALHGREFRTSFDAHIEPVLLQSDFLQKVTWRSSRLLAPRMINSFEPAAASMLLLKVDSLESPLPPSAIRRLQKFVLSISETDLYGDPELEGQMTAYDISAFLQNPQFETESCVINRTVEGSEIKKTVVRVVLTTDSSSPTRQQEAVACFFRGRAFHIGLNNVINLPDEFIAPFSDSKGEFNFNENFPPNLTAFVTEAQDQYVGQPRAEVLIGVLKHMEQIYGQRIKANKGGID